MPGNGENSRHPTIRRTNFAKEISVQSLERPRSQSSRLSAGTFALHTQISSQNQRPKCRKDQTRERISRNRHEQKEFSGSTVCSSGSLFEGKLGEERTSCDIAPSIENQRNMAMLSEYEPEAEDHFEDLIRGTISSITHLYSVISLHCIREIGTETARRRSRIELPGSSGAAANEEADDRADDERKT
ncbi:hypothetical protein ACJRO7_019170 [Eucalyptus globulus]|uniref:Uncharacterized protein n=1 Tax=Eucalyptus globulus TaxID=34317 RepID=A0ABD3KFK6_EUCGL